jgi:hypothetical protein
MRKLKIMEHISLDGVFQSSGEDDFAYADWTVPYRTPLAGMNSSPRTAGASICCSAVAPTICGRAPGQIRADVAGVLASGRYRHRAFRNYDGQ